jgi:hypothetical protein
MADRKKPLPHITLDTLNKYVLPPIEDYTYFEDSHNHPFKYQASGRFEMVNAWWLAEASMLAYSEPSFVEQRFQQAGLASVEFFSGESTQCYVAHNDHFVIVAFRGSEIRPRQSVSDDNVTYIISDWNTDLKVDFVDSGQGSFVHEGFKEALDEVWTAQDQATESSRFLKPYLDSVSNKDGQRRPVWFTGHSLGAALATLAAERYRNVAGLYTFGSPRVGDRAYPKQLRRLHIDSYRFVNNDDVVSKVPVIGLYSYRGIIPRLRTPGFYRHVGTLKYISSTDSESTILNDPGLWARLRDNFRRVVRNTWNLRLLIRSGGLPENSLIDHAPLLYVIQIWNDYVSSN